MGVYLPDEILVDILSRLPPGVPLHRFKSASRRWRSLIAAQILPNLLPRTLQGFYSAPSVFHPLPAAANDGAVDTRLGFMSGYPYLHVGDCCNGLLLCWRRRTCRLPSVFVCNPATRRSALLPPFDDPDFGSGDLSLDFDPAASPHYQVIWAHNADFGQLACKKLRVFSSAARSWGPPIVHFHPSSAGNLDDVYDPECKTVSWKGLRYVFDYNQVAILDRRIKLPEPPASASTVSKRTVFFGRLGTALCYACLDGFRLRVWAMPEPEGEEWVLKHRAEVRTLAVPQIFGFHPHLEAVLIRAKGRVLAYDLLKRRLDDLCCEFGGFGDSLVKGFPYSPCWLDDLPG